VCSPKGWSCTWFVRFRFRLERNALSRRYKRRRRANTLQVCSLFDGVNGNPEPVGSSIHRAARQAAGVSMQEKGARASNIKRGFGLQKEQVDGSTAQMLSRFWTDNPKARLKIKNADQQFKQRLVQDLLSGSPRKPDWPYGMPTCANPWLLLVGISPGAPLGKGANVRSKRKQYVPTVGKPHHHFNSERFWKEHGEWKGYWPKIRQLCVGLLSDKIGNDVEKILSLCGHLNLGEKQTGRGNAKAIDREILRWIPKVVSEKLRPHTLLLLGLKGHRKNGILEPWKGTGLEFIVESDPDQEFAFKHPDGKRRFFQMWKNPNAAAYPKTVLLLPNHPSRYPMTVPKSWESMIEQLRPIVFE
jgi:hypothetical protein